MSERIGEIGGYWLSKRRGSDCWCRTWFDAATRQTKRASLGTSDIQDAKVSLWKWYAEHGQLTKQRADQIRLEMVLTRYYLQHAQHQPSAEAARIACALWSEYFQGATVSELTTARQRAFVEWLRSGGPAMRSDGYIKRVLTVGKAALTRAYREGELETLPWIIPGKDGPPRDLVLTIDQCRALWRAARLEHERIYLVLLFCTLSRPEALLELTDAEVDLQRRRLALNPAGRAQTKKYRPVVPIVDSLVPWLEDLKPGHLIQWRGAPVESMKTAFRAMRARAGLPKAAVAKTIRHTMATELRAAGVPDAEIQGFLGHRAYSGRTEVYAKYRPDYLGAAAREVERVVRLIIGD